MTTNVAMLARLGTTPRWLSRLTVLQIVFVISGFCGLIYESIWSHYLKLFVGHAAYAQTVVLIVFVGGMAIGAWLVGRHAERVANPLAAYALVEAAVGAISLLFHGIFVAATGWAYTHLLPNACTADDGCVAQWIFAALLILPQSILLGTTFPLMTSGVLRLIGSQQGRPIALFYFLNSFGAVLGVLAAGFILIPNLGLPGTLLSAGLSNILVAVVAYGCSGRGATRPALARVPAENERLPDKRFTRPLLWVAALTGLSSFIYEIIWIRMLSLVVGASTHSFELMLAAFILGLALGGAWIRNKVDHYKDLLSTLAIVQILMGVAAIATFPLYTASFDLLAWLLTALDRTPSGYAMFNLASHGLALAIMLPATFLAGMTLPIITFALLKNAKGERAIGYVYASNTVGAIAGVAIAVHLALPYLGIKGGLLLAAAIDVLLGVLLFAIRGRSTMARALGWTTVGVAALSLTAWLVHVSPEKMASGVYRHGNADLGAGTSVLFHRDGKTATVTVVENGGVRSIRTNGKSDAALAMQGDKATTDEHTMTLTAVLPLLYRPKSEVAAVIGLGSGMSTATLLASPTLKRVDTIEIEPLMVEGARMFGDKVATAFTDERSRIVIDDAKSYFARSSMKYDLIVSEPSNPWVSGVASLFTTEFYSRVREQLSDDGLFVQWLQIYEFNDALMATIFRALDAQFTDYVVYAANQGDMIIIASKMKLPNVSEEALLWPSMRPIVGRYGLDSLQELQTRRLAGRPAIRPLLAALGSGENSDYFPVVDQRAPQARYLRSQARALITLSSSGVPIVEMIEGIAIHSVPQRTMQDMSFGERRAATSIARDLATWIVDGATASPYATLPRDAGLLRAVLFDCAPLLPRTHAVELLLDVAEFVNPFLPKGDAASVWTAVRSAPCVDKLGESAKLWLELFEAVGQRDGREMGQWGSALLEQEGSSERVRAYALVAAATGMISDGNPSAAKTLLEAWLPRLTMGTQDSSAIRVLWELAGPSQQDAARL